MGKIISFIILFLLAEGLIEGYKKGLWRTLIPFISFGLAYLLIISMGKGFVEQLFINLGISTNIFSNQNSLVGTDALKQILNSGFGTNTMISHYTTSFPKSIYTFFIFAIAGAIRSLFYRFGPHELPLMGGFDRFGGAIAGLFETLLRIWVIVAFLEIMITLHVPYVNSFYQSLYESTIFQYINLYNPFYKLL